MARQTFFVARIADALTQRLARSRVYYGWYIVAGAFMTGIATVGFNGPFFSIFLKPMSQEFGWTRTMTTGAVTVGTLIAASTGLVLGQVLDRYGPRWMVVGGCVLLGMAYVGLSQVNSLVAFYLVYAVGRSAMQSPLGRSMMNALVSKWFVRRRATAIAFATLGTFLGGIALAPIAQGIIDSHGWRQAWAFFGLLTAVLIVVPGLLLHRTPEDLGLLPDGDKYGQEALPRLAAPALSPRGSSHERREPGVRRPRQASAAEEVSLTLHHALGTVSFWLLCLVGVVSTTATTGVTFHLVPHYTDIGIASSVAASTVSVLTFFQIPGIFCWSFLADHLDPKHVLLGVLLTMAFGAFLISQTDTAMEAYLGVAIFGTGMSGYLTVLDVVWANFFGRMHLGGIRGASLMFQLAGNASGSLIAAFLYDLRGSYDDAFKAIIAGFLASSVVLLLVRKPGRGAN